MKKTIVYKKTQDCEIKADFYSTNEHSPVIMYIHGGGLIWGSRTDIRQEQIELYNKAGFAVFSIDYRLAPEAKIKEIISDVEDALVWLKKEGASQLGINAEKIVVTGGSAGGYLSLMTGTFETKPNAIISFYGYGDISADWAIKPSPYFLNMAKVPKELAEMLISRSQISEAPISKRYAIYLYGRQSGSWIEESSEIDSIFFNDQLKQWSPLYNIQSDYPPTMLLHGTSDKDVPYEQSKLMFEQLKESGIPSELITIHGGEHVFDENMTNPAVTDAFGKVIRFIESFL